ncbi:unnamed protein product [Leptidea sinapis]|uniref:Uncharacterized protein n=1 Tax=Leptidea sinapis TaxID=189913 RepID=A0A5E4QYK1_9NEOP|nr:unnamed protein product [Leptidea sinapis]
MYLSFKICIILTFGVTVECGKHFRLGRSSGGILKAAAEPVRHNAPAKWFNQKLDHFTPTDMRTWKQRYFVNDSFYDSKHGHIFLMVGGEGEANPLWIINGTWIDYAEQFRALCIMLEHRYYGASHPTSDLSVKNLQYLSSHQALADVANFIKAINEEYKLDSNRVKWIAFGGSYPGSLAAWLRVKFPHLVYASVSSSGPLQAKLNFNEYFQVVEQSLNAKTSSDDCVNSVKMAHKELEALMEKSTSIVEKNFRVCVPFSKANSYDVKNFYSNIADYFAELVQYNEDNRLSVKPAYKNITINSQREAI